MWWTGRDGSLWYVIIQGLFNVVVIIVELSVCDRMTDVMEMWMSVQDINMINPWNIMF